MCVSHQRKAIVRRWFVFGSGRGVPFSWFFHT
jgi:hypothetical protein